MPAPKIVYGAGSSGKHTSELSRTQAADLLNLSLSGVDRLLQSGYLPDLKIGRVLHLAEAAYVRAVDQDIPVLRQVQARGGRLDADQASMGDSARLSDAEVVDVNRGWWRCDPEVICAAGVLPMTRSGFFTTVLRIDALEATQTVLVEAEGTRKPYTEVRHRFTARLAGRVRCLGDSETYWVNPEIEPDYRELTASLLGNRSAAKSDGPIAYLPRD